MCPSPYHYTRHKDRRRSTRLRRCPSSRRPTRSTSQHAIYSIHTPGRRWAARCWAGWSGGWSGRRQRGHRRRRGLPHCDRHADTRGMAQGGRGMGGWVDGRTLDVSMIDNAPTDPEPRTQNPEPRTEPSVGRSPTAKPHRAGTMKERQKDRKTERQKDRKTERQKERKKEREKEERGTILPSALP